MDLFEAGFLAAKIGIVLIGLLQVPPIMLWVERRGAGLMQGRLGPNRLGPFGLFQAIADSLKFLFKEDPIPDHVKKFYYLLAPVLAVIPAVMTFAVVPFAGPLEWGGRLLIFQVAELNVGVLYIFSVGSLAVYSIIIAGWSSNSKYALFGSLRSTAQMISYELAMGLAGIGIIMCFSSLELGVIAQAQGEVFTSFLGVELPPWVQIPKWGIFLQPLGFMILLIAIFAETNRLPFDLPEGESEIVAGYHLEYGSFKFALLMLAENLHMTTGSALLVTFYFGGWQLLPGMQTLLDLLALEGLPQLLSLFGLQVMSFVTKVACFMWLFVWVRWTLPRFRYDQLMDFGWKILFPLALINVFVTGFGIYFLGGYHAS